MEMELQGSLQAIMDAVQQRSDQRGYRPYARVAADLHHALGGRPVVFALSGLGADREAWTAGYNGTVAVYAADVVAFLELTNAPSAGEPRGVVNHPGYTITVLPRRALVHVKFIVRDAQLHRVNGSDLSDLDGLEWGTGARLTYEGLAEPFTATVDQVNQDLAQIHQRLLEDLVG